MGWGGGARVARWMEAWKRRATTAEATGTIAKANASIVFRATYDFHTIRYLWHNIVLKPTLERACAV